MIKPLSWMGTYGHRSPKLSVLVGTPLGSYHLLPGFAPQQHGAIRSSVRPWLPSMFERLTKSKKKELKLSSKGVSKRYKQQGTGKKVVSRPQILLSVSACTNLS